MSRRGLVLAFALVFPSVMTWVSFVALAESGTRGAAFRVAYVAGKVVQFGLPVVFVGLTAPGQLRPALPTMRGLGLGLAFGLLVAAGIGGLYLFWLRGNPLVGETPDRLHAILLRYGIETPAEFVVLACVIAVGHSLLEEYYWRWFVYFGLRRLLPAWAALVVGSLGFMAHHVILLAVYFPGPQAFATLVVPFALAVAVGGAFWCWLYERSGTFYAPWLSHLVVDAALMAVGYDLVMCYWA